MHLFAVPAHRSYTACTAANCTLCRHNPHKACAVQLRPKYVVGQEVAAPCGANLHVALAPSGGGKPLPPGSAAATQQWEALRSCGARAQLLLVDERARQQRTKELLMSGASGASNAQVGCWALQTRGWVGLGGLRCAATVGGTVQGGGPRTPARLPCTSTPGADACAVLRTQLPPRLPPALPPDR